MVSSRGRLPTSSRLENERKSNVRADVLLVQRGLAPSRALAQRLIAGGHVYVLSGAMRTSVSKPSFVLEDDVRLEVAVNPLDRYVSRGGLKLEGAMAQLGLSPTALRCLDVGQSTGGFTDCLLQHGAASVVGVDVGREQLHSRLRNDPRVVCIEGVNARDSETLRASVAAFQPFDLIVADVSFISLTKVIDAWPSLLSATGEVLSLVKPQFEVGSDNIGRGGIVRDRSLYRSVERVVREAFVARGFEVLHYIESVITGGDGNREFFIHARKR